MTEASGAGAPPITLDAVARAAAELAAQPALEGALARFLDLVRTWAAPSAVVAVVRDGDRESGWRLLTPLCAGSVPVGTDRWVAQLVRDTPECLARPLVLQGDEIPGARVRDNVTVPWWSEGASGLLLLRGAPRPLPPNLGEALGLAAAPLWPRLLGSPAGRLEALLEELRSASARLSSEAARHLERLEALGRPVASGPEETPPAPDRTAELQARVGELESRWEKTVAALRLARAALRRAAFVPPALRVPVEEAGALVEPEAVPPPRLGVAFLDRDVVGLEAPAGGLETAGISVRLASQPEELALLLRAPEAASLDAVVCDVMCFKPDQNVAGLIRAWDRDRPGLAVYLSFDPQSQAEAERARRVPQSLTGGHLPRPLDAARLLEIFDTLARRQGRA